MASHKLFEGKTLAILTGGGDTSALNASIEAIRNRAQVLGYNVYGVRYGWKGLLGEGDIVDLTSQPYDGWYGGTALRSSRTNPVPTKKSPEDRVPQVLRNLQRYKIDVLVSIGGDDTNGAAKKIYEQHGIPVIGFPKTIDNDIRTQTIHHYKGENIESALCPGFPTAAKNIAGFAAKLCTTAESHSRIVVLEVMGRDAGWLTGAATLGGAAVSLIPEFEMTGDRVEKFFEKVKEQYNNNPKKYLIVAVSEGTRWWNEKTQKTEIVCASPDVDEFGHPRLGGISGVIASDIERRLGIQARAQITGYYARAGACSKYDKALVGVLGDKVMDLLIRQEYGKMPILHELSRHDDLVEYKTGLIDMGAIGNKSLPEIYYDFDNFQFNKKYSHFIKHMVSKPEGLKFDYNFPKVLPKD